MEDIFNQKFQRHLFRAIADIPPKTGMNSSGEMDDPWEIILNWNFKARSNQYKKKKN